jgi:hypothetical protein
LAGQPKLAWWRRPRHHFHKIVTFAWSSDGRYLAYTLMADPVDAIAFRLHHD